MILKDGKGKFRVASLDCYKISALDNGKFAVINFDRQFHFILNEYDTIEEANNCLTDINNAIMKGCEEFIIPTYEWQVSVGEAKK